MDRSQFQYDAFISYSHTDRSWVHNWLLPQLETAGLNVCIDTRDFAVGQRSIVNMETGTPVISGMTLLAPLAATPAKSVSLICCTRPVSTAPTSGITTVVSLIVSSGVDSSASIDACCSRIAVWRCCSASSCSLRAVTSSAA